MILKRLFDIIISFFGIIILVPVYCLLGILVNLKIGFPIFFKQIRPGLKGEPFIIYKFRTMTDEKDTEGYLLPDRNRLTKFGSFLRKTSLDELPSLFNVLKGDMSLIGPRPLLMHYLPLYDESQKRRHEVKPGITGWAQVNGRNTLTWKKKFELDVWYIENRSFWLDLKILILTFYKVIKRQGISASGEATMKPFSGNN